MGSRFTDFLRRLMAPESKDSARHASEETSVDYKGYMICPVARQEGSQWRTTGVIRKQFPDGVKEHHFIRADMHGAKADAESFSIGKAKKIIDERGDKLFQ